MREVKSLETGRDVVGERHTEVRFSTVVDYGLNVNDVILYSRKDINPKIPAVLSFE